MIFDEQGRISEMDHELKHALESELTTRWDQAHADAVRVANERYESDEYEDVYYDTGEHAGRSRTRDGLYRSAFRMEKTLLQVASNLEAQAQRLYQSYDEWEQGFAQWLEEQAMTLRVRAIEEFGAMDLEDLEDLYGEQT
jgi:hypothetical protein